MISNLTVDSSSTTASEVTLPTHLLKECGYLVVHALTTEQAKKEIIHSDIILYILSLDKVNHWTPILTPLKRLPSLWWCNESTSKQSREFCENDPAIDGILTANMNDYELHWALHFAAKQCFERQQWVTERKLLEEKIEERKWIDKAKDILCRMKNISEAEAYDLLRKQAMNERKRLVDVASSIVKAYQLLLK